MTANVSESIAAERERLATDPEAARIFLPGGAPPPPGAIFRQPDLAKTLEAIRDRGEDGFYRGVVARDIEAAQKKRGRPDHARRPRPLRGEGPAGLCASVFSAPRSYTLPAPSSGPVLAEMAMAAELAAPEIACRPRGAAAIHWLAEIEKRAFRDRNEFLGDPAFGGVRGAALHGSRAHPAPRGVDRPDARHAVREPREGLPGEAVYDALLGRRRGRHGGRRDDDAERLLRQRSRRARASVSSGTTRWTTSPRARARRTCTASSRERSTRSRPASACSRRCALRSPCCPGGATFAWGSPGGSTILTTNLQVLLDLVLRLREPDRRRSPRRASTSRTARTCSRSRRTASIPPGSRRSRRWDTPSRSARAIPNPGESDASTPWRPSRAESARRSPIRAAAEPASSSSPRRDPLAPLPPALPRRTDPAPSRPAAPSRRGGLARARACAGDRDRDPRHGGARRAGDRRRGRLRRGLLAAQRKHDARRRALRDGAAPSRFDAPDRRQSLRGARAHGTPLRAAPRRWRPTRSRRRSSPRPTPSPPRTSSPAAASERSAPSCSPASALVLTHCNAGALATAGYGTALGVIRGAVEAGKADPRPRRRDAALPPGRAPDGLGARARRDSRRDHHRQHGGALPARAARSTPSSSARTASPPTATSRTRSAPTRWRSSRRSTACRSTSRRR